MRKREMRKREKRKREVRIEKRERLKGRKECY